MPQLIVFLLGFFAGAAAAGQGRMERSVLVSITVIDSLTLSPIADVHVSTVTRGEISNTEGQLVIPLLDGDIISVTHINYHPRKVIYRAATMGAAVSIIMKPSVRVLREIRITDVQSEEAMKRKILESDAVVKKEDAIASENSNIINTLGKVAPMSAPTKEEQFFESLQGPKGVTILSSKGGGLIKAIKNIANPEKRKAVTPRSNYRSDPLKVTPFKVNVHPADTIELDSALVIDNN